MNLGDQNKSIVAPLLGINKELPSTLIDDRESINIQNMSLKDSDIQSRSGYSRIGDNLPLDGDVLEVIQFQDYQENQILLAVTSNNIYIYKHEDKLWESILAPDTEWSANYVDTTFFMNNLFITNSAETIKRWYIDDSYIVDAFDDQYFSSVITKFRDRLILLNTIEDGHSIPQRVRWSKVGSYSDFSSGRANFVDLLETQGRIQTAKNLGDSLCIYKDDSIIMCNWIGGQSVFSFNTIIPDIGLAAPKAVASYQNRHFFLGYDNIYEFSGNQLRSIGDKIKDILLTSINREYLHRSVLSILGEELWCSVPIEKTYPDTTFVYNIRRESWYIFDIPFNCSTLYVKQKDSSIGSLTGTIGELTDIIGSFGNTGETPTLAFGSSGYVYNVEKTLISDDGKNSKYYIETKDFVLGDQYLNKYKRLRYVEFEARGEEVTVSYSTDNGYSWQEIKTKQLTNILELHRVYLDVSVRKVRLKFSSSKFFALRAYGIIFRGSGSK